MELLFCFLFLVMPRNKVGGTRREGGVGGGVVFYTSLDTTKVQSTLRGYQYYFIGLYPPTFSLVI